MKRFKRFSSLCPPSPPHSPATTESVSTRNGSFSANVEECVVCNSLRAELLRFPNFFIVVVKFRRMCNIWGSLRAAIRSRKLWTPRTGWEILETEGRRSLYHYPDFIISTSCRENGGLFVRLVSRSLSRGFSSSDSAAEGIINVISIDSPNELYKSPKLLWPSLCFAYQYDSSTLMLWICVLLTAW